jgi:hypothetical protein
LWRAELRVGLCPDRLVFRDSVQPVAGDPVAALKESVGRSRVSVVVSNHFMRYALLPGSGVLKSDEDWLAYARHEFQATYGTQTSAWHIALCATGSNAPRLACAVDEELLASIRTLPGLASVEPYLMTAFNARRRSLSRRTAWFVLQEPGRLVLCLFTKGRWKRVRTRQASGDWQASLPDLLDRELAAASDVECSEALVCAEDELPERLGAYRIRDVGCRPRGMALA